MNFFVTTLLVIDIFYCVMTFMIGISDYLWKMMSVSFLHKWMLFGVIIGLITWTLYFCR